jgi:PQQ-like domain
MKRPIFLVPVILGLAIVGCGSPASPGSALGRTSTRTASARQAATSLPTQAPWPTQTAPSPTQVAPSVGASLASVPYGGRTNIIANTQGQGFDVVDSILDSNGDESTLHAYGPDGTSLTELPAGSFTGECGAADVINSKGRLLITEQVQTVPAAGINAATNSLTLTAWNASNGGEVWTDTPISPSTETLNCQAYDGNLQDFSATFNGRWGVLQWPLSNSEVTDAIDLTNGKLYPRSDLQGTVGNYVAIGNQNAATLTSPGTWQKLGTLNLSNLQESGPGAFAATGQAVNPNSGNPGMEASPDGTELAGALGSDSTVSAYALPSGRALWSIRTPPGETDTTEAINASVLIIGRARSLGDPTTLIALDVKTGKILWKTNIGNGALCDLTSSQVLINVNDQLATLSASTGAQLSYEANPYQDPDTGDTTCPATVANGITGVGYNDATSQITQILNS